jgi:hypothetical protein
VTNSATIIKVVGRAILWLAKFLYSSRPSAFIRKWGFRIFIEVLSLVVFLAGIFFTLLSVSNMNVNLEVIQSVEYFWNVWWHEERSIFSLFREFRKNFLKSVGIIS